MQTQKLEPPCIIIIIVFIDSEDKNTYLMLQGVVVL